MNRIIHFKTMMMDSIALTGATSYNFFDVATEDEDSVTTFTETDAVRWLIVQQFIKNDFAREFFSLSANTIFLTNLVDPFTWHDLKPGDIDLLLANLDDPSKGIAFECKRVKIITPTTGPPKINGIKQLANAISQVNAYRYLGFHKTYLLIMLLDDGRRHSAPNPMFHYASGGKVDQVFSAPRLPGLHEDVGVIYLRINQMSGKHINHSHSIGYCIDKPAAHSEQSFDMTAKVEKVIQLIRQ